MGNYINKYILGRHNENSAMDSVTSIKSSIEELKVSNYIWIHKNQYLISYFLLKKLLELKPPRQWAEVIKHTNKV